MDVSTSALLMTISIMGLVGVYIWTVLNDDDYISLSIRTILFIVSMILFIFSVTSLTERETSIDYIENKPTYEKVYTYRQDTILIDSAYIKIK